MRMCATMKKWNIDSDSVHGAVGFIGIPLDGFECLVKHLQMAPYKPGCELPNGQATPFSSSVILSHIRHVILLFTSLAWFPISSHSNTAVTLWFTSPRTFGDSCAWRGIGSFTFDLKYRWILNSTIDSWTWFYLTVQMRTHGEHLSKRGSVTCDITNSVLFFLWFFWLRGMEKFAIHDQKNLTIKSHSTVN